MDLALDNLQRLICHKTHATNQPTILQNRVKQKKNNVVLLSGFTLTINCYIRLVRAASSPAINYMTDRVWWSRKILVNVCFRSIC